MPLFFQCIKTAFQIPGEFFKPTRASLYSSFLFFAGFRYQRISWSKGKRLPAHSAKRPSETY
jgi:hypothetical protein